MKMASLPLMVMIVVTALICFFALSGVKASIADAMYILGLSFCCTHVLIYFYSLGKTHGNDEYAESRDTKVVVDQFRSVENSKPASITNKNKHWNPIKDFQ